MALTVIRELASGMVHVSDPVDGFEAAVAKAFWTEVEHLPESEKRHRIEQWLIEHRRDTTGDRSAAEGEQVDAASQGQGERHEQDEEGR